MTHTDFEFPTELSIELAEAAVKYLYEETWDAEEDAFSVYKDYSGRGMYGKTCIGFNIQDNSVTLGNISTAIVNAAIDLYWDDWVDHQLTPTSYDVQDVQQFMESARRLVPKRQDNLGLGMIYY